MSEADKLVPEIGVKMALFGNVDFSTVFEGHDWFIRRIHAVALRVSEQRQLKLTKDQINNIL